MDLSWNKKASAVGAHSSPVMEAMNSPRMEEKHSVHKCTISWARRDAETTKNNAGRTSKIDHKSVNKKGWWTKWTFKGSRRWRRHAGEEKHMENELSILKSQIPLKSRKREREIF